MDECFIIDLSEYPELLTPSDLVKLGLYTSTDAAYLARVRGLSPDFIQRKGIKGQKGKIFYTKKNILDFLKKHFCDGSIKK